MTSPLTAALAELVAHAVPWLRYLDSTPRPDCTVEEATQIDLFHDAILEHWMAHHRTPNQP